MQRTQDVSELLSSSNTSATLRTSLQLANSVLEFAHHELGLPDNGSYRDYVDLQRPYVVWNVFAAPEFSLQLRESCFPIAGCLSYRGYFDRSDAMDYAAGLRAQGWDVYVGGVAAYSTLGWFRDPLLNTILDRADWEIARIIFHELAHQKLFIDNDPELNEAFAETVAMVGLDKWQKARNTAERQQSQLALKQEDRFVELVLRAREELTAIYGGTSPDANKRQEKARVISKLQERYLAGQDREGLSGGYNGWFASGVNNASLGAIATYRLLVPRLLQIYRDNGEDPARFYHLIESLKSCSQTQRRGWLINSLGKSPGSTLPACAG